MKSILEFTNQNGTNCLMASFQPMWRYTKETGELPLNSPGMVSEIEETLLFLIEEGKTHGVEMSTILNMRQKNGSTLFGWATQFSEKISLALLERNVVVNTISSDFTTPEFVVS